MRKSQQRFADLDCANRWANHCCDLLVCWFIFIFCNL